MTIILLGFLNPLQNARADFNAQHSESLECVGFLRDHFKQKFRNAVEEINYTNQYNSCWAESLIFSSKTPQRSFIGRGLEVFANPAYVMAAPFSKQLCFIASQMPEYRGDYPCWFERDMAVDDMSVEAAVRKEAPKILFSNAIPGRDSTSATVEWILCTNDDPTKPKEYSMGCSRGKKLVFTEYGRGDINNDNEEDILVNIKYGNNDDEHKKCFIGVFTRKQGQLLKMISFSPNGLCE